MPCSGIVATSSGRTLRFSRRETFKPKRRRRLSLWRGRSYWNSRRTGLNYGQGYARFITNDSRLRDAPGFRKLTSINSDRSQAAEVHYQKCLSLNFAFGWLVDLPM
jgi:hypothetical protein